MSFLFVCGIGDCIRIGICIFDGRHGDNAYLRKLEGVFNVAILFIRVCGLSLRKRVLFSHISTSMCRTLPTSIDSKLVLLE